MYESQDPEMDQIMKTIKKQEEEEEGAAPNKPKVYKLFIGLRSRV